MISAADREKAVELIDEAVSNGRPNADHSNPRNKLPTEARYQIIEVCNQPEYASKAPCEIVPDLADKGSYIASESTFYPVLQEEKMQNHRGRSEAPKSKEPTTYRATAPNQVYMWDITYLNGPHKGMFYQLYLFSDLYDRSIVGWEVYEEESAEHAEEG